MPTSYSYELSYPHLLDAVQLVLKLNFTDVWLSQSAKIAPFTVIGSGTAVGNYSEVSNSVIGEGCIIGSNVLIEGCYIWDKVTIEDGCKLKHAIVCNGVIIKSGAVVEAGVVLSFKVFLLLVLKHLYSLFCFSDCDGRLTVITNSRANHFIVLFVKSYFNK